MGLLLKSKVGKTKAKRPGINRALVLTGDIWNPLNHFSYIKAATE